MQSFNPTPELTIGIPIGISSKEVEEEIEQKHVIVETKNK